MGAEQHTRSRTVRPITEGRVWAHQSAPFKIRSAEERFRMLRSSCLSGSFLILLHVSVAHAIDSAPSRSAESFVQARDQIVSWALGFVAKKRGSIAGSAKPEGPVGGPYRYVDGRMIFGKTARKEECALHLGRRLESGDLVFNFYLENKKRAVDSVSKKQENSGSGSGVLLFEGALVLQSEPTVSNIEGITSLDLHTTASSISLLGLQAQKSGTLGEESLSIVLDSDDNIIQTTYRFINGIRIREGRRTDSVTCHFYHIF